jgi:glycosyltransferase involved in cell wall biosynthesis/LmbE family N-acetylglucosaminyl deacetylase
MDDRLSSPITAPQPYPHLEADLMPYAPSPLPDGRRVLVLAAHPDDEVFGCGATLALLAADRRDIHVVLATSGVLQDAANGEALAQRRLNESAAAAGVLGYPVPRSLGLPDRSLRYDEPLIQAVAAELEAVRPDLVFAPACSEMHPDHRALAMATIEAVRRSGLTLTLLCYEVGVPLRPNCLIDITPVAARKHEAAQCFVSQLAQQPYDVQIQALNRFRSYTLPAHVLMAEAFLVLAAETVRTNPHAVLAPEYFAQRAQALPMLPDDVPLVSVLIRSSGRDTLVEALNSVAAQLYGHIEIVVVDVTGGHHAPLPADWGGRSIRFVSAGQRLPRAEAANAALDAARGEYLTFLDDDDWIDADHIAKLVRSARQSPLAIAWYTGIRMVDASGNPTGDVLDLPFDPDRLLWSNFLPIHGVMFSRRAVAAGCRFDSAFKTYEDWDFWLQVSRLGAFVHQPGVSGAYRRHDNQTSGVHETTLIRDGRAALFAKWLPILGTTLTNALAIGLTRGDAAQWACADQLRALQAMFDAQRAHWLSDNAALKDELDSLGQLHRQLSVQEATVRDERDALLKCTEALQAELTQHRIGMQHLLGSRSWRYTEPLRRAGRRARAWRDRLRRLLGLIRQHGIVGGMGKAWARLRRGGVQELAAGIAAASCERPAVASADEYSRWIATFDTPDTNWLQRANAEALSWQQAPRIDVLMPVYNPPEQWLRRAIESLIAQCYPFWTLCIADDASTDASVRRVLADYAAQDARIRVVFRAVNGHISAASNSALALCEGDFTALMDQDDELPAHALYVVASAIRANPRADVFYSDEDKIDVHGRRFEPYFKPDWNPDLFLAQNMLSHLGVYRTGLLKEIGGFREGLEGSQDYDLALRAIERAGHDRVVHIPHVLYHWRALPTSTAAGIDAKPYAFLAAQRAVREHLERVGVAATVEPAEGNFFQRVRYALPDPLPLLTVIIPTRDGFDVLARCLTGLFERTTYARLEVLVVDNGSVDPRVLDLLSVHERAGRLRVLRDARPFNYSALNNRAVREARGELLCFLNNDIDVISPDWLEEMAGQALRPEVGAVGAKLLYPNDTVQHAGVVLGMGCDGIAGHAHWQLPRHAPGYFYRAALVQNMSAVTAACMVMRRTVFESVGGFNETDLAVAYNDVDLCLRIGEQGLRIVWTPYALLYHHESLTRGSDLTPENAARFAAEVAWMRDRWGDRLRHDPAFSPNLALDRTDAALAHPPRVLLSV